MFWSVVLPSVPMMSGMLQVMKSMRKTLPAVSVTRLSSIRLASCAGTKCAAGLA